MRELALVTGGKTGIGAAIVAALTEQGYEVRTASRREGCDLLDRTAIAGLIASLPRLDLLVNNAGIAEAAPLKRTDDALWDRHMALNVTAPFLLCRAALPLLQAGPRGRIVNVASTAALRGSPYIAAYAASKHALLGLTRALAAELAPRGVFVHAICPGFVDSPLLARSVANIMQATERDEASARAALASENASGRLITPAEVGAAVAALAARTDAPQEQILE